MKIKKALLTSLVSLGFAMSSHAAIVSAQSDSTYLRLGDVSGVAGAGVSTFYGGALSAFGAHLASYAENYGLYDTTTGLYSFSGSDIVAAGAPASHANLGVWAFKQVGSNDIWYGEWAKETSSNTADASTHTVFYVGDNTGTTVPTTGTATYTVNGVNNGDVLSGTYAANFASGKLTGTLTGGSTVSSLSVDSNFSVGSAAFSGTASATGTSGTDSNGAVSGQFFGANAASLAGIATFANTKAYDTAFGGTKN